MLGFTPLAGLPLASVQEAAGETPITFFGYAAVPTDSVSATNATTTITLTPPTSMQVGDLVFVSVQQRGTATFSVGVTGGQTWNTLTRQTGSSIAEQSFWCTFNGTWDANPRFDLSAGTCTSAQMLVFRPGSTSKVWGIDNALAQAGFSAPTTPFTVTRTGVTRTGAKSVAIAAWYTADDNTWGSLSGSGWSKDGLPAQFRNTSGTDQSATYAYNIGTGATGNVSQNQASLGGDAGRTAIISFVELDPALATVDETLGALTSTGTLTASAAEITATLSKTLDALTSTGTAKAYLQATVDETLGALTSTGAAKAYLKATVDETLGTLTSTGAAKAYLKATVDESLGTLTSIGTVVVGTVSTATLNKTLGTLTGAVTAKVQLKATVAKTLGTLTSASSAQVLAKASLSKTLGVLTSTGTARVLNRATLGKTLGALTLSSAATVAVIRVASLDKTLGALTSAGTVKVLAKANLVKPLGALASAGTAKVFVKATLAKTLGALTLQAEAGQILPLEATLNQTLGELAAASQARVTGVVEIFPDPADWTPVSGDALLWGSGAPAVDAWVEISPSY